MPIHQGLLDISGRPIIRLGVLPGSDDSQDQSPETSYIHYPVSALIDTGAGRSQIDINVARSFALSPTGDVELYTASTGLNAEAMPLFLIDLLILGDRPAPLAINLEVVGSSKLGGLRVDMLLGRDVLGHCLLVFDGPSGRFSLAHNPPAKATP